MAVEIRWMPFEGHLLKAGSARGSWRAAPIAAAIVTATWLAGCSGSFNTADLLPIGGPPPPAVTPAPTLATALAPNLGAGGVKVGLILPLSASGNAGTA